MREVICVNIGQAGVQIGNSCWTLFCLEHNIQPNWKMTLEEIIGKDKNSFNIFFFKTENEKYIPRTIFLDLDSSVIDEIRTGKYNKLYYPEQLISGKEDCTNKCSMGYCTLGKNICL